MRQRALTGAPPGRDVRAARGAVALGRSDCDVELRPLASA